MENKIKFAVRKFIDSKPFELVAYGDNHDNLVKFAKALSEYDSPFSYSVEEYKQENRTRLEIISKLVEGKHITFEEGMMLMEPVKHPLNFPGFRGTTEPILGSKNYPTGVSPKVNLMGPTDEYR